MSKKHKSKSAGVGLPGASVKAEDTLRHEGIDPDRLFILHLGLPRALLHKTIPPWAKRIISGFILWFVLYSLNGALNILPEWLLALLSLLTGLLILQGSCEALVTATERLAARRRWNHYTAGTVAEILSTLPELVVIAFVTPVSPLTAFVIALITIYNNTLVFSLYSYLLPKDTEGRFLMPRPITEIGSKLLAAGATIGLTLGLVMLGLSTVATPKISLSSVDLTVVGMMLLCIFGVYLYKLVKNYASEEQEIREVLDLNQEDIEQRLNMVYENVRHSPLSRILLIFAFGVVGAFFGGERVADFAATAIDKLQLNDIVTALILAVFAGMSEYVILWRSHRKQEYGIALANAFGGITQVMFLVFPFTLLSIAVYQAGIFTPVAEPAVLFTLSNILLLLFLFPTFYILLEMLREDHTLDILDTTIMTLIVLLLIGLLVSYGANGEALSLHGSV